jgi:hypothetical protein
MTRHIAKVRAPHATVNPGWPENLVVTAVVLTELSVMRDVMQIKVYPFHRGLCSSLGCDCAAAAATAAAVEAAGFAADDVGLVGDLPLLMVLVATAASTIVRHAKVDLGGREVSEEARSTSEPFGSHLRDSYELSVSKQDLPRGTTW